MKDDERQTGQTDRPQSHYTQVVVTLNIACIVYSHEVLFELQCALETDLQRKFY